MEKKKKTDVAQHTWIVSVLEGADPGGGPSCPLCYTVLPLWP